MQNLKTFAVAATLALSGTAQATTNWSWTSYGGFSGTTGSVHGYYANNETATFSEVGIATWSSGIGVDYYESSPEHAIDNEHGRELVLFKFDHDVTVDSFRHGWVSQDSDTQIFAYTGGGDDDLGNLSVSSLTSNGWTDLGIYANPGTNQTYTGTSIVSNMWAIGVATSGSYTGLEDYVKLKKLTGSKGPDDPGTGVNEPATLALMGLGLVGMQVRRRRA